MECAVCFTNNSNCKLICGHSFCSQCVKDWYQKGSEQTCPFCRRNLYFKGMYKVIPQWEEERYYEQRDEAFADACEQVFEAMEAEAEDSEEEYDSQEDEDEYETVSGSDWDSCYGDNPCEDFFECEELDERLDELSNIQDEFNRFSHFGYDPSVFVQAYAEGAILDYPTVFYEDYPTKDYMFVSKYGPKPVGTRRIAARTRPMGICV